MRKLLCNIGIHNWIYDKANVSKIWKKSDTNEPITTKHYKCSGCPALKIKSNI